MSEQLLTLDRVTAYMIQVELVPKNKRFSWRDARMGADGHGKATIISNASTVTIQSWFKAVGLWVTQFSFNVASGERTAYFRVMPVDEGQ